jgi:hypothetical protein
MAPSERRGVTWGSWAAISALVLLVHRDVYTIPFLYSEIPGIQQNSVVTSLDAFAERMLTVNGTLQRPLSVFSYALDHALYGGKVWGFHLTNVLIHCVNVLLVLLLARRFFAAPLVAGFVFALHPLATAVVSQVFGRNYSLATTFSLLALYLYLGWRARGRLGAAHAAALALLFLLTVLSKQSLVTFPLLVLWTEVARRAHGPDAPPHEAGAVAGTLSSPRRVRRAIGFGLLGAGAAGIVAALVTLYAAPLSRTAVISPWTFALSQFGNALLMARFYLLPYQTALIHDLRLYRDLAHPEVWAGAALLAALAWAAWRWRARPVGWLLGAFLISLVPTNSLLPKNELVREWRLYPSLAFFALLAGEAAAAVWAWLGARRAGAPLRLAAAAALGVYLATYAHSDVLQNRAYQSSLGAWQQVLAHYPYSADAMNNIGLAHYHRGELEEAQRFFAMAVEASPDVYLYRENLARALWAQGAQDLALEHSAAAKEIFLRHGGNRITLYYR